MHWPVSNRPHVLPTLYNDRELISICDFRAGAEEDDAARSRLFAFVISAAETGGRENGALVDGFVSTNLN